jgi:hypothetical protein
MSTGVESIIRNCESTLPLSLLLKLFLGCELYYAYFLIYPNGYRK